MIAVVLNGQKKKKSNTAIPKKFELDLVYSTLGQNQRETSKEQYYAKLNTIYFEILDQIVLEFYRQFNCNKFVYMYCNKMLQHD